MKTLLNILVLLLGRFAVYHVVSKLYIQREARIVEPYHLVPGKGVVPAYMPWARVPSDALRPSNFASRMIFWTYLRSTPDIVPVAPEIARARSEASAAEWKRHVDWMRDHPTKRPSPETMAKLYPNSPRSPSVH